MAGELLERSTSVATAAGDEDKELAEQQNLVHVLPHDVIADVLSRLAPRWLAASRCVCRDWRAAIDARRLLRADLLPLSTRGIFVHFSYHRFPELLASFPSSRGASAITGTLEFLPNTDTSIKIADPFITDYDIQDHCNGLLLIDNYVVNPATRRWDSLPPCPPSHDHPVVMHTHDDDYDETAFNEYLAFDPTVSPHYKVLVVPHRCFILDRDDIDPMVEKSKFLTSPSRCTLRVFSSRYGSWKWRSFVREGSVGQPTHKLKSLDLRECAVYWRGVLYVQRDANFVVR
nr:uncharacterized protein LOC127347953 [Lolium perenne]